MGKPLTYEVGRINIGRRVRWKQRDGGNPSFAVLVGASPKHAEIKPDNYSGPPKQVPWPDVLDWTSRNPGPLKMPEPEPKPVLAAKIVTPAPAPAQTLASSNGTHAPRVDPFAVFGTLSAQMPIAIAEIDAAEEEIDTATEMLQAAQARHAEAVRKLADLRKQIATATAVIDMHLIGTSHATTT